MSFDTIQTTENGTVRAKRRMNSEVRTREHLFRHEVDTLIEVAKQNKRGGAQHPIGQRHALMIMVCFNHGLRASELVDLRWSQIDFKSNTITVQRLKGSDDSTHHLTPDEIRGLKKIAVHPEFVFPTERNMPMTTRGFHKLIAELGVKAGMKESVHPHMLRHAKGYDLANRGTDLRLIQSYLGHRNVQNTVGYTQIAANRLKGLER
jgi:site-specific recombinase XerD